MAAALHGLAGTPSGDTCECKRSTGKLGRQQQRNSWFRSSSGQTHGLGSGTGCRLGELSTNLELARSRVPPSNSRHPDTTISTPGARSVLLPTVLVPSQVWSLCVSWGVAQAHLRLGVCAVVLDDQDRVLLTRRAAHMRTFPAAWVLPGGGLEGEDKSLSVC